MAKRRGPKLKIRLVEWGLANRMGNVIEIHKDLPKSPKLLKPILAHEIAHTSISGFTWKDFKVDFLERQNINRLELYKFMLKRPKTWIQFLPFYYQPSKGFVYDVNKTLMWLTIILIIGIDALIFGRLL